MNNELAILIKSLFAEKEDLSVTTEGQEISSSITLFNSFRLCSIVNIRPKRSTDYYYDIHKECLFQSRELEKGVLDCCLNRGSEDNMTIIGT